MEKIEEKNSDFIEYVAEETAKVEDFQKKYNVSQKNFAYILGKNLSLFICMLVPLLMIALIWTDFRAIVFGPKMISDGIFTVMMFAAGEITMMKLGAEGGKLDVDYKEAKREFDCLVEKAGEVGTLLLGIFCDWQIDLEMQQAISFRLRVNKMTPKMWEEVKSLSKDELVERFGKDRGSSLAKINELKPIELNEAILLYNGEYEARGGVPQSGDTYLKNRKRKFEMVFHWIFTGFLTLGIALTLTEDFTVARVIYTLFKLVMLLFRMAQGYDRGARAYNTIEVRQLKAKSNYLKQYVKFVEDKIYLKLGDKYGDVSAFAYNEDLKNIETN